MKKKSLLPLALSLSLLAGCGNIPATISATPVPHPSQEPSRVDKVEQLSDNDLVLRLMESEQSKNEQGNVILSPLSIKMALGMAANGAEGEAKTALETVLGMDSKKLNDSLSAWTNREDDTLSIANSMWFNESLDGCVNQDFKDALTQAYQAGKGIFRAGSAASAQ